MLIAAQAADDDLGWEMDFDDPLHDPFQTFTIPEFGAEMTPPGKILNSSRETNAGAEPAGGQLLVIEDLSYMRPASNSSEKEERYRWANFSIELPEGWDPALEGGRYEGNLTLEGACALVRISWFEDSGIDPESCLRQAVRAYRSEYLRFSVLTVEAGEPVAVGGQWASSLNVYYKYGDQEAQKRLIAWSSPVSGRFFYAFFWSCPEAWEANLEKFELLFESFRDEGFERYVELEPRPNTLDGWGLVLSEILSSYRFAAVPTQPNPEVEVKVVMKSHREGGRVNQLASEEIVSPTRKGAVPLREEALQKLLRDRGYGVAILQRGGAYWVVVQDPLGRWQAISSVARAERGLGTLIGPGEAEWYRGLVVDGPKEATSEDAKGSSDLVVEKNCEPPREVHLKPAAEVNLTWILGLRDLLDRYRYSQEESESGSFLRAQVLWALLEREGYDAWLVTGYQGHPLYQEMWVVLSHPGGGYVAVRLAAAGDGGGLGEIVSDVERFDGIAYDTSLQYSCLHPDRGLSIDPGMVRTPAPG
ncbi:MAG: hypothetical protein WCY97_05975 [Methanothrix sp.]|nr:hypothetical protein [Methanothrix sp.]MDD3709166.1 hypothetical protein [Methanothrix sp.]MDI9400022.1 hypothetical protein [Euryarchaeota archaeon]